MSAKTTGPVRQRATPRSMSTISKAQTDESKRQLESAALAQSDQRYVLRLYVTGTTPRSAQAIEQVRSICEDHLHGRYELQVIDIYQMPSLAKDHQIVAAPTLIKVLPSPLRRFIGDLSKSEKILFGLDLREKK
jgi:circadian clock protein KaiB